MENKSQVNQSQDLSLPTGKASKDNTLKAASSKGTQATILAALELSVTGFVRVNGRYLGDVLALQGQGLVTSQPAEEGMLEVRAAS